jgi:hypothetical protein
VESLPAAELSWIQPKLPDYRFFLGACGDGLGTIMAGDMGMPGHSQAIRALKVLFFRENVNL